MTAQRPDEDLGAVFQAQRAAERAGTPSYARIARGSIRPRPGFEIRWLLLSGALTAIVAGVWLIHRTNVARELELARSVMHLESPTASLLTPPSLSLLDSIPRIGVSVPGSPLRALDPGGPLAASLSRSN